MADGPKELRDMRYSDRGLMGPKIRPLTAMWEYRWLIGTLTVFITLAGLGLSMLQPIRYVATARLLLSDSGETGVFSERRPRDPERRLRNEAELIRSSIVPTRVSLSMGGRLTPDEVAERISVEAAPDLDLLLVSASDASAEGAAELANTAAEAYQLVSLEDERERARRAAELMEGYRAELQATIDEADRILWERRSQIEASLASTPFPSISQRLDAIEQRVQNDPGISQYEERRSAALAQLQALRTSLEQITIDTSLYGSGVDHFEPAVPPTSPARPRPLRDAALAGVFGLIFSVGLAWNRAEREAVTPIEKTQAARERQEAQLSLS